MYNPEEIYDRMRNIMIEINSSLNMLYIIPCVFTRNVVLNQLRCKFSNLNFLISLLTTRGQIPPPGEQPQLTLTTAELARYNGKNGNPAYVAVNGVVYDVTDAAGWAAATHFGLTAGRDLTSEFISCHRGAPILNKLKVVGRLMP
jgi:predicted heme/steroid binding protein